MESLEILKNIIRRERKARKAAEAIIEQKSLELYWANLNLKDLNGSLEEKIKQRTHQIETSKEALLREKEKAEAATKAKSEFLSNMSHEIRTPLNAIIGLTELIMQDVADKTSLQYASSIQYSAHNLMHLINGILDFSKIESGEINFNKFEFSPTKILKGVKDTFQFNAEEKALELLVELDQRIPPVLIGDSGKLNQILVNLVGNAFKFTEKGYIRVYFKQEKREGNICHLLGRVEDTGVGIPLNKLGSIFQSFELADNSTNRLSGGTGLGLTITEKLVTLQGGKIWVDSVEQKGTSFSFSLPFEIAETKEVKSTNSEKGKKYPRLENLKVLVVEDIKVNRFLMKQVFNRKNITPDFAVNGKEAIEILASKTYDLVLMDIHMPVMDGKEATKIIRDLSSPVLNHQVTIIALSADAFEETQKEVLELGMDGFLTKPVDIDQLYETLNNLF